LFILVACDSWNVAATTQQAKEKFEFRVDKNGRMLRLNKATGEITVVGGGSVRTVGAQPVITSSAVAPGELPSSSGLLPKRTRSTQVIVETTTAASASPQSRVSAVSGNPSWQPMDLSVPYRSRGVATTRLEPIDLSVPAQSEHLDPESSSDKDASGAKDMLTVFAGDPRPPVSQANGAASEPITTPSLRNIHKMFVDKMPNDLDQYVNAEITKQFKGRVVVVLRREDADAILRGTGEKKDGVGAAITGRYLGLHDNATGSISLVDKDERVVLWSSEAGDRSLMWGAMARSGPRKVAARLVKNLKNVVEKGR